MPQGQTKHAQSIPHSVLHEAGPAEVVVIFTTSSDTCSKKNQVLSQLEHHCLKHL